MRHFSVFLLATLFPLIFMGCKSEEDSYPPIHYGYNLAFVDENGNDLIEGMQTGLGRNGKPALTLPDRTVSMWKAGTDFLLWQSLMHYGMDINMTRSLKY